jgi:hypothetical protein
MFVLAMALSSVVWADELSDVDRLLDAKSYPQAVALLTRLADSGNASAQLRLGQMYWYGEGVVVDRAKADALFAKSAATGNKDAIQALGMTAARQQHLADIEYWTTKYDGADLTSAQFECKAPPLPDKSTTNAEIKSINDAVNGWKTCYNGFVKNIDDAMPAGKRIPAGIADLMTDAEMEQAKAHLGRVYNRVAADAKARADTTLAAVASWQKGTEDYVRQRNLETAQRIRDQQVERQNANRNMPQAPGVVMAPRK